MSSFLSTSSLHVPPAGTGWTAVLSKGRYGTFDGSSTSFNTVLTAAIKMGAPVIRRDCAGCDGEHKTMFYRRNTPVPATFDLFECIKSNWTIKSSNSNAFNVDFELYSTLGDALAGNTAKRWTFCNGDDLSGVGFPRDCGSTTQAMDQWNSFSGRGGQPDVLFAIATSKTPGPPEPQPAAPTPAPPSQFCPKFHPVRLLLDVAASRHHLSLSLSLIISPASHSRFTRRMSTTPRAHSSTMRVCGIRGRTLARGAIGQALISCIGRAASLKTPRISVATRAASLPPHPVSTRFGQS